MPASDKPKANRWMVAAAAVLIIGAIAYLVYPLFGSANKLPTVMASPDFTLPDVDGKPVSQNEFSGKVRLVSFMFTSCPDICPMTTANMVQMQQTLREDGVFGEKVAFVAITFDPEIDTPDVLREYADRMNMDMTGWTILRGEEAETKQLMEKYGLLVQKLRVGQFVHSVTSLLLIDGNHQVRKIYKMGEEMNNAEIMRDIQTLLTEQEGR